MGALVSTFRPANLVFGLNLDRNIVCKSTPGVNIIKVGRTAQIIEIALPVTIMPALLRAHNFMKSTPDQKFFVRTVLIGLN